MTRKKKRPSKKNLSKWHGRLGLLSCFFVVLLAITGVLINHAHDLSLDRTSISNKLILSLYGMTPPPQLAVQVEDGWLVWQGTELYYDGEQLLECKGNFVGAITLENYWVAACEGDLMVFTYEQELIERVDSDAGIAYPITKIGACEALLCYQVGGVNYQLDIETLTVNRFSDSEGRLLQWSSPEAPPKEQAANVARHFHGGDITWERLLQDLHAGRFMGRAGPYIMDAVALLFLVLSGMGFAVWLKRKKPAPRKT